MATTNRGNPSDTDMVTVVPKERIPTMTSLAAKAFVRWIFEDVLQDDHQDHEQEFHNAWCRASSWSAKVAFSSHFQYHEHLWDDIAWARFELLFSQNRRDIDHVHSTSRWKRCHSLLPHGFVATSLQEITDKTESIELRDYHINLRDLEAWIEMDIQCSPTCLSLSGVSPTRAVRLLCQNVSFHRVKALDLTDADLNHHAILRLVSPRRMRDGTMTPRLDLAGLQYVNLSINPIGDVGARKLAECSVFANATYINLSFGNIGEAGARALAESNAFANATRIDLCGNPFGDAGVQALAESNAFTKAQDIILRSSNIGEVGTKALATHHRAFANATTIDLSFNQIGDAGVEALATHQAFPNATTINLSSNQIGDAGLHSLVTHRAFPNATTIDLSSNQIGDAGVHSLVTTHGAFPKVKELLLDRNPLQDPEHVREQTIRSAFPQIVHLTCRGARIDIW